MKQIFKKSIQVLLVVVIMLMAIVSVQAMPEVKKVDKFYFDQANSKLIDFEDAKAQPWNQYHSKHAISFVGGGDATILRINSDNRGKAKTASGEYSISNDANYPDTSANHPLNILFDEGVKAAGFYLGNGNQYGEQVKATISLYDENRELLAEFNEQYVSDSVTTFFGVESNEPIHLIVIDYGNSLLSEEIDDLMYVDFLLYDNMPDPATPSFKCGDSRGDDGYYSACPKDTIRHNRGLEIYVKSVSKTVAVSKIDGILYKLVLGEPIKVKTYEIEYNYAEYDGKRALIKISSTGKESPLYLTVKPGERQVYLDWNDLSGLGSEFDKYNIRWNEGRTLKDERANSWIDYGSYYDLRNISEGYWTFQVCPIKKRDVVGSCSNTVSVQVKEPTNNQIIASDNLCSKQWTLDDGDSLDLDTLEKGKYSKGDLYFIFEDKLGPSFWANNLGQRGMIDLGASSNSLSRVKVEDYPDLSYKSGVGYYRFGVKAKVGHIYAALTDEGFALFKVLDISDSDVKIELQTPKCADRKYSTSRIYLTVKNNKLSVELDWNDLPRFGDTFDEYNIQYSEGNRISNTPRNAYISYGSYYNLKNLKGDTQYTFRVCPSKDKQVVGECSTTKWVKIWDPELAKAKVVKVDESKKADITKEKPFIKESAKETCDNGCEVNGRCIPVGTRLKQNQTAREFCSWQGKMVEQASIGQSCENDYECSTNSCLSGTCNDLQEELSVQRGLLERILTWLENLI